MDTKFNTSESTPDTGTEAMPDAVSETQEEQVPLSDGAQLSIQQGLASDSQIDLQGPGDQDSSPDEGESEGEEEPANA